MNLKEKTMQLKNWAVVGATNKKNKFGYLIPLRLKENDYQVYPVNPKLEEVAGLKCYSSLNSIKSKIDVVDLVVNPEIGIKVMEEIKQLDIKYVWLQPGARSDQIKEYAKKHQIEIIESCIYASLS
ncbi:CoA-binding protein [Halanaerobium praevalens]|uniref:CoA-binding domain protein n=1 Tax=Halanaerobium praevalens (strain ATCC 33744 / DSM 2228 / GSL) TaxID=572479 RepID=E3DLR9_HALPG|nr:CoA-binding protein [Halanaerobium praevalens]ADO77266.1 CoA-binding domain protein [Halanaerobium praevalens DSM 2228]